MNRQLEAAWQVHEFLIASRTRYAVIGGVAVQYWGEPRFTQDVDLSVEPPEGGVTELVERITERFPSRTGDPVAFALETRMVLVEAGDEKINVDIALALPGYEDELFDRVVEYEIGPGMVLHLCSAEDLIVHKAVAGRPQDQADIRGIVERQGEALDVGYIRRWLSAFAETKGDPGIQSPFEEIWNAFIADSQ